jgi:hypothetical protein
VIIFLAFENLKGPNKLAMTHSKMRLSPLHQAALGTLFGNAGSEPDMAVVPKRELAKIESPNHEITIRSHPRDFFQHSFSSTMMSDGRVQFATSTPDINKKYRSGELVVRGTFNEKPTGTLILAAELATDEECKWSPVTKVLSLALLKVIGSMLGNDFSWSIGDARGIKPHIAFPLLKIVDEFHFSNSNGRELKTNGNGRRGGLLGRIGRIEETEEEMKRRMERTQEVEGEFDRGTEITFRAHLHYVDFANWVAVGIPLIHAMPLSRWWSDSPLKFSLYTNGDQRRDVFSLTINNAEHTRPPNRT